MMQDLLWHVCILPEKEQNIPAICSDTPQYVQIIHVLDLIQGYIKLYLFTPTGRQLYI